MPAVIGMQFLLCLSLVMVYVMNVADSNDHRVVNWFFLPTLLAGILAAMFL